MKKSIEERKQPDQGTVNVSQFENPQATSLDICSRNQLVVFDENNNKQESFQKFVLDLDEIASKKTADPIFGLDRKLHLRITFLAINNASIKSDELMSELKRNFLPSLAEISNHFPISLSYQVAFDSMNSFVMFFLHRRG